MHDVLLYHMVISDLHAAGCPSGTRLTQYQHMLQPNREPYPSDHRIQHIGLAHAAATDGGCDAASGETIPVTIGDGGMGEPYVLNSMMHFNTVHKDQPTSCRPWYGTVTASNTT